MKDRRLAAPSPHSLGALIVHLGLAFVVTFGLALPGCNGSRQGGDGAATRGLKITVEGTLQTPESVLHDTAADVYLVANINGSPFGTDGAGYIGKIRPDGTLENPRWIAGGTAGVRLDAPKGMAIVGDVLLVADVTVVRRFDRKGGKPLGEVRFEGASFLNDLAAADDGTVFVSDTGLGPGFEPTGTDAIWAISPAGETRSIAKGKELGQPNGLLADGNDVLCACWADGAIRRVSRDGKVTAVAKLPQAQLDGIVRARDGAYLVSSWAGSCVYRVTEDGKVDVAVRDLNAPADLGYDAGRGRLLIPFFKDNRIVALQWP